MKKFALAAWTVAPIAFLYAAALGLFSNSKTAYSLGIGRIRVTASPRSMLWTAIISAAIGMWAFYEHRLERKKRC